MEREPILRIVTEKMYRDMLMINLSARFPNGCDWKDSLRINIKERLQMTLKQTKVLELKRMVMAEGRNLF
jgi:hypothetical protein